MKKYLPLIFVLTLFSCEKFKEKTGELTVNAQYKLLTKPNQIFKDEGATIYIFKGININTSDLKFDGQGNLKNTSKSIPFDKTFTLDNKGAGKMSLEYGTYAVACVSNNTIRNGSKRWAITSTTIDTNAEHLDFDFDDY